MTGGPAKTRSIRCKQLGRRRHAWRGQRGGEAHFPLVEGYVFLSDYHVLCVQKEPTGLIDAVYALLPRPDINAEVLDFEGGGVGGFSSHISR